MDMSWNGVIAATTERIKKSLQRPIDSMVKHVATSPMAVGTSKSSSRIVKRVATAPMTVNAKKPPIPRVKPAATASMAVNAKMSPIHMVKHKATAHMAVNAKSSPIRMVKHRVSHPIRKEEVVNQTKMAKIAQIRPSTVKAPSRILKQKRVITIGSDCTGLGTDEIAMRRVLGLKCDNVFASEINAVARRLLIAGSHAPAMTYEDITSTARRQAPHVDVYTAGFPCQPYSAAGLNLGKEDHRCVASYVVQYIKTRLPTLFVLENVKNLLSIRHKAGPTQQHLLTQPDPTQCQTN